MLLLPLKELEFDDRTWRGRSPTPTAVSSSAVAATRAAQALRALDLRCRHAVAQIKFALVASCPTCGAGSPKASRHRPSAAAGRPTPGKMRRCRRSRKRDRPRRQLPADGGNRATTASHHPSPSPPRRPSRLGCRDGSSSATCKLPVPGSASRCSLGSRRRGASRPAAGARRAADSLASRAAADAGLVVLRRELQRLALVRTRPTGGPLAIPVYRGGQEATG